ncbi:hypothetical protein [Tautonia plasticadhaerens]|uniref:Uncharacterized protein n=1 Tax=Tautonia plasticadhaerens TaxID=2527974 RepID=A0A518GVZ0_9BACT|nr:hypothetical protein [Tautonia plasticadhaerens]QDV32755.1 hypothetical protein ElP_05950 [Tautonia plasticadhaerens]
MPERVPTRSILLLFSLTGLLGAGCGGPREVEIAPEANPTFGEHGGPLSALPGGGFFEVTTEAAGGQARLVAYFYSSEAMDGPLSPLPSDVRIDLAMPGGESTSVTLAASAGGGGRDRPGVRFASEPGDYAFDPLVGTLNATIGGQPASVPFSGAQS